MLLLEDELEEFPLLDLEWPKFAPIVPLLEELFKPDDPLEPDDPLYVAARAAIPAGFPPDAEAVVLLWDLDDSLRLKTPEKSSKKSQCSLFLEKTDFT